MREYLRARVRDDGFTLIELLITIVILGVIVVPIANLMISYFLNTSTTTARMSESHDEQIAAAYWQQDVSSVGVRSDTYSTALVDFPFNASVNVAFPCTVSPGSNPLVVLAWNQYDSAGKATQTTVEYATDSTGTSLLRMQCTGTAGGQPDSIATLAHDLDAGPTAPAPSVKCEDSAGTSIDCSDHSVVNGSTTVPAVMILTFSVSDSSGRGQPYHVELTGQRRQRGSND